MAFQITVAFVAVLYVAAMALPVPTQLEEKAFYDVLPEEIKNFYNSLSEADVQTFVELLPQLEGKDQNQIYELVKARNPDVAERAKAMYSAVFNKINSLPEVPKKFMTDLLAAVETFQDERIHEVVKEGETLPQEAKDAILGPFPTLRPILKV